MAVRGGRASQQTDGTLLAPPCLVPQGDRGPRLCLSDSRRDDDPGVQRLLCTREEAHTLPALMLAAWALARGLARHLIASVLAERAERMEMLDDAGQPHMLGECCLLPKEAVGTLSPSWPCAGQPPQRRGWHGRAMPPHHGDHRHGKTP